MMFMGLRGVGFGDALTDCNDKCNQAYIADSSATASDTWNACLSSCQGSGASLSSSGGFLSNFMTSGGGNAGSANGWLTTQSSPSPAQQSQSGWAQALQALTAGLATGAGSLISSQTPHPAAPAPAPTPWYLTPVGIIAIVGIVGGGAYFLAKK